MSMNCLHPLLSSWSIRCCSRGIHVAYLFLLSCWCFICCETPFRFGIGIGWGNRVWGRTTNLETPPFHLPPMPIRWSLLVYDRNKTEGCGRAKRSRALTSGSFNSKLALSAWKGADCYCFWTILDVANSCSCNGVSSPFTLVSRPYLLALWGPEERKQDPLGLITYFVPFFFVPTSHKRRKEERERMNLKIVDRRMVGRKQLLIKALNGEGGTNRRE